jgi:glycosyltransferase involved in cell wall biosynthesis
VTMIRREHGSHKVVMFQRRPLPGQHSVERVFDEVRRALPPDIDLTAYTMPFESRGIVKRLRNMFFAFRRRGDINHIAGDIHYIALVLPRRSTILTVLDLVGVQRLTGIRRVTLVLLWYRLPVWWASCVTVISESVRGELVSFLPSAKAKTVAIHCPVSSSFRPSPSPYHSRPVILQVGTAANKNLLCVVRALRGLNVHLRIIGRLNSLQLGYLSGARVCFSDTHSLSDAEMVLEYSKCDIVVFISSYEGFGLPILEAQATGRPVITSSLSSMPEVAGKGALFVDPSDTAQVRSAICSVMDDRNLYDSLVRRGFANVLRFHSHAIAASYANVYRNVSQARARSSRYFPLKK